MRGTKDSGIGRKWFMNTLKPNQLLFEQIHPHLIGFNKQKHDIVNDNYLLTYLFDHDDLKENNISLFKKIKEMSLFIHNIFLIIDNIPL